MTDQRVQELIKECKRQEESCAYTAVGLYIWEKWSRSWNTVFIVAPIILGGAASSELLANIPSSWTSYVAAGFALLAGFFPAIYKALGMDMRVSEIGASATEFTNLRDRFRQMAAIHTQTSFEEFQPAFEQLMDRMDAARSASPTLPEWCFKEAQKKLDSGDYDFSVDDKKGGT